MNIRVQEIVNSMNTFTKASYHRSEVLPELFALQQELVNLTFNGEHAELANLKIWDVEKHLEQLNAEHGGIATEALERFKSGCKDLCNMIKAEISGSRGEAKAFRSLERLKCNNIIIRNLELTAEDTRTEIDALVITAKGIFIIEVKNTSRDIFIDEQGNFFRTGEFLKWDSNIADKMSIKEQLLRDALNDAGFANSKIMRVVVFTDSRIEVNNKYEALNTCFLSQLPYIIQDFKGTDIYTLENMRSLEVAIENARTTESYPMKIDISQLKLDFATVMATLEEASAENDQVINIGTELEEKTQPSITVEPSTVKAENIWNLVRRALNSRYMRLASTTAAAMAVTVLTTAMTIRHN